jgi:hypothetical protein
MGRRIVVARTIVKRIIVARLKRSAGERGPARRVGPNP